jgi:hypothetical protein
MEDFLTFLQREPEVAEPSVGQRESYEPRDRDGDGEVAEQKSQWENTDDNKDELNIGLRRRQNSESSSEDSSSEIGESTSPRKKRFTKKSAKAHKQLNVKKGKTGSGSVHTSTRERKQNGRKRLRQVASSELSDSNARKKRRPPAAAPAESKESEDAIQSIEQYVHADAAPRNADGESNACVEGIIVPCPFDSDEWQAEVNGEDVASGRGAGGCVADDVGGENERSSGSNDAKNRDARSDSAAVNEENKSAFCFLCEFSSENEIITRMTDFAASTFGVLNDKVWAENIKKYYDTIIRPTVVGNKEWTVASIARHFFRDSLNQKIADKVALRVLNNCLYAKQMTMCNRNKTTNEKTLNDNNVKVYCTLIKQRQSMYSKK